MPINELISYLENMKKKYGEDELFTCFTKIDIVKEFSIIDSLT